MNATASPPFPDVPERIAQVIFVLCQTVTMRCSLRVRTLTAAQVEYICGRLLAARTRFRRVIERIRAGKPPKARAFKPRTRRVKPRPEPMSDAELNQGFPPPKGWKRWAREDRARARAARLAAAVDKQPVPLWRALRQHVFAWLCPLAAQIPEFRESAPACANELRRLLADPEMQALLMASRAVGDSLRPVCWGLGVERSLLYPEPAIPAALAMAEPDPSAPTPSDMNFATPPTAATASPENSHGPGSAVAPSPPSAAGDVPSFRASPDALATSDFFASG